MKYFKNISRMNNRQGSNNGSFYHVCTHQHLDLPWKNLGCFFYRGKTHSHELCIQFLDIEFFCFMLFKQLLHPFIEMESTFGPTMKKIGCFFYKGKACNCGIHLIKIEICFMFCKQLLQPFSEMESTSAIIV